MYIYNIYLNFPFLHPIHIPPNHCSYKDKTSKTPPETLPEDLVKIPVGEPAPEVVGSQAGESFKVHKDP